MYELGKKDEVLGVMVENLRAISDDFWKRIEGRPTRMPITTRDELVICGFDQGLGEKLLVCESLEDMQELFDKFNQGYALRIAWYRGELTSTVIWVRPSSELVDAIVRELAPDVPQEVKEAISAYAMGYPGVGKVLALKSGQLKSAKDVEDLVGWPLIEHNPKKAGAIWLRFRNAGV